MFSLKSSKSSEAIPINSDRKSVQTGSEKDGKSDESVRRSEHSLVSTNSGTSSSATYVYDLFLEYCEF